MNVTPISVRYDKTKEDLVLFEGGDDELKLTGKKATGKVTPMDDTNNRT